MKRSEEIGKMRNNCGILTRLKIAISVKMSGLEKNIKVFIGQFDIFLDPEGDLEINKIDFLTKNSLLVITG